MAVFNSWGDKYVRVHIDMAHGVRYTFSEFAVNVRVTKKGAPDLPEAEVTLHGLGLDMMEQLTSLTFLKNARQNNILVIEAGYTEDTIAQIYRGEITKASADFNATPDVTFIIESKSGSYPSVIPQSPIAVKGQQPAIEVIKQLASQIGYNVENNGITTSISNTYIQGSPIQKIKSIANAINADLIIDDNTIVITPRGEPRKHSVTPVLSAENGLIGYPTLTDDGIDAVCFFNPEVRIGSCITIDTIVPKAKGTWKVTQFTHELEVNSSQSAMWRTSFSAVYVGK